MTNLLKAGRICFGIAMAGVGFQQFYYGDFHPMLLPPLHAWIPGIAIWAYVSGTVLMAFSVAIIIGRQARLFSLVLGAVLLAVFIFYYIPYELIIDPNFRYLGEWSNAEKELALAGGAFVIAGSFTEKDKANQSGNLMTRLLEKFIPYGSIFFSITMISFGIDHLLYTAQIAKLVPTWIPNPVFWTYIAAVALIGSGIAIVLKIKLRLIANLLGIMIFLWIFFIHIPRAIAEPFANSGEEVTSAFSALAFSSIAFVIAGTAPHQPH
jgi:uncharacterized membrane protein YphA (DoxX/SURF4 family)